MLQNKIAVITGAGKGIGRATAELFLNEGAKVVLATRTKSDLDSFIEEHKDKKENIITVSGDVSEEKIINKIVTDTINEFGTIDILVNNAGFGIFNNMADSKVEDFDAVFNTNVRALYLLTRDFLPYMIKQKSGTIINIASIAGKQGFATGTIYCASKHAVMGLSRALMLEVRQYNIRVIAICPGSVATDFFRPEANTPLTSSIPSVLHSMDIADSCLYAATLPPNAMVSEIEIRPTNPRK